MIWTPKHIFKANIIIGALKKAIGITDWHLESLYFYIFNSYMEKEFKKHDFKWMEAEAEAVSSHCLWKRKLLHFIGCGSGSGWQKKVIIGSGSGSYWKKNLHFWMEAEAAKIFFTKMEAEAEAMKFFFTKLKRKRKRHQDLPLPKHC